MKIHPTVILLLSLALTMGACLYSNNGIYSVEPVPGDPATVSVTTNLDTLSDPTVSDTLDLDIRYKMQVENGRPYYVDCWVENLLVYQLGFYYDSDDIYIAFPDTVIAVTSDTTLWVVESDTLLAFVRDTLSKAYTLGGLFLIPGDLPVLPGDNSLTLGFYYSANTNSLADVLGIEAESVELEYTITFEEGGAR